MARILVTGGAGYVGSICCAQLRKRGHSVAVIDDLSTGHVEAVPQGCEFYRCDIGDVDRLRSILMERPFDAVFHFAAKALIPESVRNPGLFFDVNVASSIRFLECLRAAGVHRFVFSSSAAVYGNPIHTPIQEDHSKQPVNSYGATKLMLEQVLQWYSEAYRWNVTIFRYFNASGAAGALGERHEPETHVIPLLLQAANQERQIFEIYGTDYDTPDGTCVRDYVHVLDIADAHVRALNAPDGPALRVYNLGAGRSYSVRQVCDIVQQVVGRPIPTRNAGRRAGDPAVLCASPQRAIDELGWKPANSDLNEIVQSAWNWKLKYDRNDRRDRVVSTAS